MTAASLAGLHGAPAFEIGPLAYLVSALLHLLAIGAVAVLVFWAVSVAGTLRAALSAD